MDGECHYEIANFEKPAEAMHPSRLRSCVGYSQISSSHWADDPIITCNPASRGIAARGAIKGNVVNSLSYVGGGRGREREIGDWDDRRGTPERRARRRVGYRPTPCASCVETSTECE